MTVSLKVDVTDVQYAQLVHIAAATNQKVETMVAPWIADALAPHNNPNLPVEAGPS